MAAPALMGRFTILGLLVLVGVLTAVLVLRDREHAAASRPEEALFPGLDANAIDRLEVENLERGTRVTLERDPAGRWSMISPVPYPAGSGMLSGLLQALRDTRGAVLLEPASDPAALGLDPPRAVVVWRVGGPGGTSPGRGRLEIGGDSIGDGRVFARAGDRVLRISKAFYNLLQVPPDEYRDRSATGMSAADVVSLRRRGWIAREPGGEMEDLALDALLEPGRGWVLQAPRALLDPMLVSFLLRDSAGLRIDSFTADDPGDVSPWGLADPRLTIELEDAAGGRVELHFGTFEVGPIDVESAERWFVRRKGYPHVWGVNRRVVGLLSAPREELVDTLIVRAARDEIASIELGEVTLDRDLAGESKSGRARWRVRGPGIHAERGAPADETRVLDVLAALEFARVEAWEETPDEGGVTAPRWLASLPLGVTLRDGRRLGGEVFSGNGVFTGYDETVRFRRFGDELVGTVGADAVDLVLTDAGSLRERRIPFPIEFQMGALELRAGDVAARFERDPDTGRWSRAGVDGEAGQAFFRALEALQALEAVEWLDAAAVPDAPGALGLVEVLVTAAPGVDPAALVTTRLAFGDEPAGERAVCLLPDGAVVAVRADLVDALRSLLH